MKAVYPFDPEFVLRRLWSDYRHAGWGAGESRAMYRRAVATGAALPAASNDVDGNTA